MSILLDLQHFLQFRWHFSLALKKHTWNAKETEAVVRPVSNNRLQFWHFDKGIKIGKENNGLVGGQGYEYVPQTMHVREADGFPLVTKKAVGGPAEHCAGPCYRAADSKVVHSGVFAAVDE
jgi:hypothetical protein